MDRETFVGNVEGSVFGDVGGISLEGVFGMGVVLECRNAEGSVFGEGSGFCLRDYLE